jgi:Flp pilus assembly pilin Flp
MRFRPHSSGQGRARSLARRFIASISAATAIEYSLIAALLSIGIYGIGQVIGSSVLGLFELITDKIP